MKKYCLLKITLFLIGSMVLMSGCKYDVADPPWDKPVAIPALTVISSITPPDSAIPGVNTITIQGQNFGGLSTNTDFVYFDDFIAEIVQASATSITVRRPNHVSDSCAVRVSSPGAWWASQKFGPYKIKSVFDRYSNFVDTLQLGALAVDNAENLFVVRGNGAYTIWRVQPDSPKTALSGSANRAVTDARIHNNMLYLFGSGRASGDRIDKMDITTGQVFRWIWLPAGKYLNCGDFGPTGYLYTGGYANGSSDLCIVRDTSYAHATNYLRISAANVKTAKKYTTDEILAIRVYNGYVYVASRQGGTTLAAKIYKHAIVADSVGVQELVVDLGTVGITSTVKGLTFSATGIIYITIDNANPLLVYDGVTVDYFYKGILPPNGKQCYWGTGNYLYMISNDPMASDKANKWNVIRIKTGTTGAPYY